MEPLDAAAGLGEVVERVNKNTVSIQAGLKALQDIADSYAAALPASVADRKALHEQLDALSRSFTALSGTVTTLAGAADAATTKASAASSAVTALTAKQPRVASGAVPAVTTVLTTISVDVTLTWPTAWPDTTYTVLPAVEVPAGLLGKTSVTVKSKTTAAAVITVTTSAVIAAGTATVRAASFA